MNRLPSPHRPRALAPIPHVAGVDYDVLDELIGYTLRRAQVAMFLAFHEATRGLEITPPRFTALVIVGANPGLSQTVLGRVLGIARSGAMLLTDWLVRRKLAERRPHPEDRRSWGLFLTLRGESLLADLKRTVRAHDGQLGGTLTETQRRTLLRLLRQLAE